MNTLGFFKDVKEEWYAIVNFFSALSEYDFIILLESITKKSGIGLESAIDQFKKPGKNFEVQEARLETINKTLNLWDV
jgi:hypothetical protein